MNISRGTGLIIKYASDDESIITDVTGPIDGKFGFSISFWKNGQPHISPLISARPQFNTGEEASAAMNGLIEEIKAIPDL